MAYFDQATVEDWAATAERWLIDNHGIAMAAITTGRDAWAIAHRCGITAEAYTSSRYVTDGHVQTALEKIFPNAVFLDKKAY